ncbi:Dynein light chain, cytoplasmic-like protein [Drosera capensis]
MAQQHHSTRTHFTEPPAPHTRTPNPQPHKPLNTTHLPKTSTLVNPVANHCKSDPKASTVEHSNNGFSQDEEKTVRVARESKWVVLEKEKKKGGFDGKLVLSAKGKMGNNEEKSVVKVPGGGGGIGRRRSVCDLKVELGDFFVKNGVRVVSVDMAPLMQIHAVSCARKTCDSLEKFTSKTLALTLKKEFDAVYGPAWHCIVGKSFGSFVTHSVGGFLYFSMDQKLHVLLFKTTVQVAD